MAEKILVELPDDLAQQIRVVATQTQRSVGEVLVDVIRQASPEPVLEQLSDEELLTRCNDQMTPDQEEELGELLDGNREGTLSAAERCQLEELMRIYRAGLVRKARALKVAVDRGLLPRLS